MKLRKDKSVLVLEALLQGHKVHIPNSEYGDITVALAEDNHLCMKMIAQNDDGSEREWLTHNIDDSLKTFIDMCNTLTEDEGKELDERFEPPPPPVRGASPLIVNPFD